MQSASGTTDVWQTTVDGSGRVLLPAELRHELRANKGTTLTWVRTPSGLQLKTFEQSIAEIQSYYQGLAPADGVWSDDILQQRRLEASRE